MAHNAGSGDKLARGAVRAVYTVRDEKPITQEKWDEMFGDFDPEAFRKGKKTEGASGEKETTRRAR